MSEDRAMRLATRIGHYFSPINPIVIILGALWTRS